MSPKRGYRLPPGLEPRPAPGDLLLVQEFVNTRDLEEGHEGLETAQDLQTWLSLRDLWPPDERVGKKEWENARALREGLRGLIRSNDRGRKLDKKTVDALNRTTESVVVPHRYRFDHEGSPRLVAMDQGWPGVLARILGAVADAVREGRWERLKECRRETCRRIFYDTSSNRSGIWCNSRRCGNRVNTKAYRRRGATWRR